MMPKKNAPRVGGSAKATDKELVEAATTLIDAIMKAGEERAKKAKK